MSKYSYKALYEQQIEITTKMRERLFSQKEIVDPLSEENNILKKRNFFLEKENELLKSSKEVSFNYLKGIENLGITGIESEYFSGSFNVVCFDGFNSTN